MSCGIHFLAKIYILLAVNHCAPKSKSFYYILTLFVFKGRQNTSAKPCPGGKALKNDRTCTEFKCSANDCKNAGTCESDEKCVCNKEYTGIDCTLKSKFIYHNSTYALYSICQFKNILTVIKTF